MDPEGLKITFYSAKYLDFYLFKVDSTLLNFDFDLFKGCVNLKNELYLYSDYEVVLQ